MGVRRFAHARASARQSHTPHNRSLLGRQHNARIVPLRRRGAFFAALRRGKTIKLDGKTVNKEDITSDNFTVRWYVMKYDNNDG